MNLINPPTEYSDRARDTIKKRLLSNKHTLKHNYNNNDDNSSLYSDNCSSYQSSIFSNQSSIFSNQSNKLVNEITLEDALPKTFYDMYSPEILLSNPTNLFFNGRPKFTKRELIDWDLNDIRSLLIIEKLRPEWGGSLPIVINPTNNNNNNNLPQFKLQLLPLCSTDDFIINTLVNSDLYLEANLDYEFKLTSAKYTVQAARKRHQQLTNNNTEIIMNLTKPEWRNIIENYLLNIAVETQCRFDFKQRCSEFKKWKLQQFNLKKPDMPPPSIIPPLPNGNGNGNNLLKKTLIKNLQLKSFTKNIESTNNSITNNTTNNGKISLKKEEKTMIWAQCQAQVYQRLGLDWKPDGIQL